ncbi:MAG: hypothetical protein ABSA46_04500 [Thermodesulfovibrionales bacterium]|jgi:hypothetical protein
MNINSIQASNLPQNSNRPTDRTDSAVDASIGSSSEVTSVLKTPQASTQGITAGVDYVQQQLQALLTSYPPWFPAGTYQNVNLITKGKAPEDQTSDASPDDNLKKTSSETKLPEQASDDKISAAPTGQSGLGDAVKQISSASADSVKPGTILNVKV